MSTETIALIDGDIFAYEIAAGAEEPIHWGDGLWTLHAWEDQGRLRVVDRVHEVADAINADRIIVALTDDVNWRNSVLPSYKENRVGQRKPMILKPLKEQLKESFETFIRPGLEADDVLGILSTWPKLKGRKVIITKDKDLKTIPGLHFHTHRTELGVFEVTEHQANYHHLQQALTGDITDGYKGCPGIGPAKADKILLPFAHETKHDQFFDVQGAWEKVVEAFAKAGLSEQEALVQARVARICRASDYDFKTKKVKLWNP